MLSHHIKWTDKFNDLTNIWASRSSTALHNIQYCPLRFWTTKPTTPAIKTGDGPATAGYAQRPHPVLANPHKAPLSSTVTSGRPRLLWKLLPQSIQSWPDRPRPRRRLSAANMTVWARPAVFAPDSDGMRARWFFCVCDSGRDILRALRSRNGAVSACLSDN